MIDLLALLMTRYVYTACVGPIAHHVHRSDVRHVRCHAHAECVVVGTVGLTG